MSMLAKCVTHVCSQSVSFLSHRSNPNGVAEYRYARYVTNPACLHQSIWCLFGTDATTPRALTSKPFGVNLTLLPALKPPDYPGYVRVIVEEGVKIVETAGRSPKDLVPVFKENGACQHSHLYADLSAFCIVYGCVSFFF